jgi:hypothetical protein
VPQDQHERTDYLNPPSWKGVDVSTIEQDLAVAPPALDELRQLGWRRLLGYLRPYRWQMAAAVVGLLVASAIGQAFRRRGCRASGWC